MKDFFDDLNNELGKENKFSGNPEIMPKERYTMPDHRELQTPNSMKEKLITNFPETNFYLPTLRNRSTRFLPIGGNSEKGKNMFMIQYGDEILIVNTGLQKPERGMFGAKYGVPDISFLIPAKKKVKGILISNIHEHNLGALIEIASNLDTTPIYTNVFTAETIKKALFQNGINHSGKIKVIKDGEKVKIGAFEIKSIETPSSAPSNSSFVVKTENSKSMFISDTNIDKAIDKLRHEKNITTLISDSYSANKKGHQRKNSDIKNHFESIIKNDSDGKTIVLLDSSIVKRISFIIDILSSYGKHIFFASKDIQEIYKTAEDKGFVKTSNSLKKIINNNINSIEDKDKVFIVTGGIENEKSTINKIIDGNHNYISLNKGDKLVLPNSFIFPEKKDIENSINKLISDGINVVTCDFLDKDADTHPFSGDLKKLAKELKPKYIIPASGDGILRNIHKNIISDLGYKDVQIPLLNNGEMVDVDMKGNIFKSNIKAPIQNIIADGFGIGVANSHVIKARRQMMNSGVLVLVFNTKADTREIMGPIRLETRGLVYIEEVRQIHRLMIKKARAIYESTLADVPEIENKDLIKIVKTDLEAYITKAIDREPMIIPIIVEV